MLAHGANTRQDTSEFGWLIEVLSPKGDGPAKDVHKDGAQAAINESTMTGPRARTANAPSGSSNAIEAMQRIMRMRMLIRFQLCGRILLQCDQPQRAKVIRQQVLWAHPDTAMIGGAIAPL